MEVVEAYGLEDELFVDDIASVVEAAAREPEAVALHDKRTHVLRYADGCPAPAAEGLDVPPETEATRRCVTHHACACHERLAEVGRRYLARLAKPTEETDG